MIPVSAADCVQGFSAMNGIKTELRNRMKACTLDRLVRIAIDGPSRKDFDFVAAAKRWIAIRDRQLTKMLMYICLKFYINTLTISHF